MLRSRASKRSTCQWTRNGWPRPRTFSNSTNFLVVPAIPKHFPTPPSRTTYEKRLLHLHLLSLFPISTPCLMSPPHPRATPISLWLLTVRFSNGQVRRALEIYLDLLSTLHCNSSCLSSHRPSLLTAYYCIHSSSLCDLMFVLLVFHSSLLLRLLLLLI